MQGDVVLYKELYGPILYEVTTSEEESPSNQNTQTQTEEVNTEQINPALTIQESSTQIKWTIIGNDFIINIARKNIQETLVIN